MRELTRTNRPFGLTIKLSQCDHPTRMVTQAQLCVWESRPFTGRYLQIAFAHFLRCQKILPGFGADFFAPRQFPGGHIARVTPVPIPNTEVKPR